MENCADSRRAGGFHVWENSHPQAGRLDRLILNRPPSDGLSFDYEWMIQLFSGVGRSGTSLFLLSSVNKLDSRECFHRGIDPLTSRMGVCEENRSGKWYFVCHCRL